MQPASTAAHEPAELHTPGSFAARTRLDGAIQSVPQQMDDGLLVQTRDGDLYSLSIK